MIRFVDIYKSYQNGTRALKGISLRVDEGEFLFIVGPSGAGKSTIIKLINAELRPTEGAVTVNGYDIGSLSSREVPMLRRTLGVVFQDFRLIDRKTVYDNVAFAMKVVGAKPRDIRKRVHYVLELVGIKNKARRRPHELSGGERQRVAIARALVNNPKIIIADEPTGNIDPELSLEIMTLLERINALGTTLVVITHEKDLVNRYFSDKRVVALESGRIISDRTGGYFQAE